MELINSLKKHELWLYFAWQDIVMRYRRTVIGPIWLIITTIVSIVLTAVLGSLLFKLDLKSYFMYVACGMIAWSFISVLLTESCTVFVMAQGLIKNINIPLLTFCFRLFFRNIMVFMHNFVIVLLAILYFTGKIPVTVLALIPIFIVFFLNSVAASIILGFLGARLRDIAQAVPTLISILSFATPIMWRPEMLGDKRFIADLNPFTHFVALIREPLLGSYPSFINFMMVAAITILNCIIAYYIYLRCNKRLIYWL